MKKYTVKIIYVYKVEAWDEDDATRRADERHPFNANDVYYDIDEN